MYSRFCLNNRVERKRICDKIWKVDFFCQKLCVTEFLFLVLDFDKDFDKSRSQKYKPQKMAKNAPQILV